MSKEDTAWEAVAVVTPSSCVAVTHDTTRENILVPSGLVNFANDEGSVEVVNSTPGNVGVTGFDEPGPTTTVSPLALPMPPMR